MKMSKNHWYVRFLRATKGIFRENPVLSLGLAIPFAAVAASSLQTAVGLSIGMLLAILPAGLIMPFVAKKVPEWLDYPLTALIAALFLMPTRILVGVISPALMDSVGVYFSLLCVSTLLFAAREQTKKEEDLAKILLHLLKMWLGAVLVLLLVGIIREVLGNGTLWGKPLTFMKVRFSGVMVSGMGFILLGFLSAFFKKIHRLIVGSHVWLVKKGPAFREKLAKMTEKEEKSEKKAKNRKKKKALKEESPVTAEEATEPVQNEEPQGKEQD